MNLVLVQLLLCFPQSNAGISTSMTDPVQYPSCQLTSDPILLHLLYESVMRDLVRRFTEVHVDNFNCPHLINHVHLFLEKLHHVSETRSCLHKNHVASRL